MGGLLGLVAAWGVVAGIVSLFVVYKVAQEKNRDPFAWALLALVASPIVVLIALAAIPQGQFKEQEAAKGPLITKRPTAGPPYRP